MKDQLQQLKQAALTALQKVTELAEVDNLERQYLGKKGELTHLLKQLKDLSPEEKRTIGPLSNDIKKELIAELETKKQALEAAAIEAKLAEEAYDITIPGKLRHAPTSGTIHPLTQVQQEVETIFSKMGFAIADGPEIESEYYNFEALNIPGDHPARDMQDTFFVENEPDKEHGRLVLRTHTSPVQIRTIQKYGAPLRIIVPGRVFRYEAKDATHDDTFYQVEGLMIEEGTSLADLKGVMQEFLTRLFQKEAPVRFRPGYFPFVEPGVELDLLWKKGENGEPDKWLEFMGAGMVHPNVLKAGGLDPDKYQGWAFGFGLTRLTMMRYGIDDIRLLQSGDLRFLQQF